MGGIGQHLPVIPHPLYLRCLEAEGYDRIHKKIHKIMLIRLIDPAAHVQNTVQCCPRKLFCTDF